MGYFDLPEVNVAIFAFLLNFPWEFLQVPFFEGMPGMPHWDAVLFCTRAAVGDVGIALVAFWGVAGVAGTRSWLLYPTFRQGFGFVAAGLAITLAFEWLAIEVWDRWEYADAMPTLPVIGTGALPILQWLLLPPVVIWFAGRQIRGGLRSSPDGHVRPAGPTSEGG